MTIKQFIKRKPKHTDSIVKGDSKKKRTRKEGTFDPWSWCDADDGLLEDPGIYMNVDTDNMVVNTVTIEGEVIETELDIQQMKDQIKKWRSK